MERFTAEREEIARALLAAASPRPWTFGRTTQDDAESVVEVFSHAYSAGEIGPIYVVAVPIDNETPVEEECKYTAITGNGPTSAANARLISQAPDLLEEALSEIRHLRSQLDYYKALAGEGDQ